MPFDNCQVPGDLSDILHEVGSRFRYASDGLSGDFEADGIDPSTSAAMEDSHAETQRALDHGAGVSDTGREFSDDVEEQAEESADDIDGVHAKTELSSGHVSQAPSPSPPPPAMAAQQPAWGTAAPQQMAMPASMGSMGGGGGGSGQGFSFPNLSGGAHPAGSGQTDVGRGESAGYTRPHGPSVFQNLDAQQMRNAKEIVNAGLRRNMSRDDIQIALMTALTESGCRRLANSSVPDSLLIDNDGAGHDHDSVGPFQQRQSWGATVDLMDPASSADLFYNALLKVPNRDQMDMGAVAQAVQRSAAPDAYAKHQRQAAQLLDEIFAG